MEGVENGRVLQWEEFGMGKFLGKFISRIFHTANFSHREFFSPRIFHFANFSTANFSLTNFSIVGALDIRPLFVILSRALDDT